MEMCVCMRVYVCIFQNYRYALSESEWINEGIGLVYYATGTIPSFADLCKLSILSKGRPQHEMQTMNKKKRNEIKIGTYTYELSYSAN